jgi:hypothetical protein
MVMQWTIMFGLTAIVVVGLGTPYLSARHNLLKMG